MNALVLSLTRRKRAQWDENYEKAMKLYIDLGVELLQPCREGLLHYRTLTQQVTLHYT